MPIIQYGKECKDDDDCETKVCEMTYDTATEKPKGRFCLQVNQEYGKICNTGNDCGSGECNEVFNDTSGLFEGRRCKMDGTTDVDSNDVLGNMFKSKDGTITKLQYAVLNPIQKSKVTKKLCDDGLICHFIVHITDSILGICNQIIILMKTVFKDMFNLVWKNILGLNKTTNGPFGGMFFGLIHSKSVNNGKCLSMYWFRMIITILLPPFGVFLSRGIMGFPYILLCSFLTALFYFPGLIYAFAVINSSSCDATEYKKK